MEIRGLFFIKYTRMIPSTSISDGLVAAIYTLGCKLNQLESESIADAFRREGFSVAAWDDVKGFGKDAHLPNCGDSILVINTCTVTSKSEQKARRIIRKALRDSCKTVVIVTGCYAQMEAEALESLGYAADLGQKRLFVIPGDRKSRIMELPRFLSINLGGYSNTLNKSPELSDLLASWAAGTESFSSSDSFSSDSFILGCVVFI